MSETRDEFLTWLQEAGRIWDGVKPEDVMAELGREPTLEEKARWLNSDDGRVRVHQAELDALAAQVAALREFLQWIWVMDRQGYEIHDRAKALLAAPSAAADALLSRVRAEEREACAKVAEEHESSLARMTPLRIVAAAIRARDSGQKPF